jgi:hypothetical protein
MTRIAKLLCFVALLALTFVLAADTPRAEAHPHCTLQQIEDCNEYCAQFGCLGTCVRRCLCAC